MKIVHLFLAGIVVFAFNACEKQPYSKLQSMESIYPDHGEHGAHGEKKAEHSSEKAKSVASPKNGEN